MNYGVNSIQKESMVLDYHRIKSFWDRRAESQNGALKAFNLGTSEEQHRIQISNLMEQIDENDQSAVDLGCGGGRITIPLAQRLTRVVAVDFAEKVLEILKKNLIGQHISNVTPLCANCFDPLTLESNSYDAAIIFGVFSCLNDQDVLKTVLNAKGLIKLSGKIIVRESVGSQGRYEIDKYSDELESDYCAIYRTPDEIENYFLDNGFKIKLSKPLYQQRQETGTWFWVFEPK